jgi:hypothetical protein
VKAKKRKEETEKSVKIGRAGRGKKKFVTSELEGQSRHSLWSRERKSRDLLFDLL